VPHRGPERRRRLAGEQASGTIGDGPGDHDRQPLTAVCREISDCCDRCLGVERVEDGLDQKEIGTALDQACNLLGIGGTQRIEGDGAKPGI